ncbi:methyltransferase domain-containing protein [Methylorubrum podarium]|uniref:methyltransferase domain-containing protein n=1 Tax=Methylorubrum podarium TaxID=200476 RepID=UPI0033147B00
MNFVLPQGRTGVEIGPLTNPLIRKDEGDVLYADHLPTDALRRQYDGHPTLGPVGTDGIVPVDVVLGEGGLADALGPRGPVDYIVASHVVEHVPNAIGWLREAGDALREGGVFCLIVPDKRFTFDHFRRPTTAGALVAAHLAGLRKPPVAVVYEHFARASPVEASAVWKGRPVLLRPISGGPTEALSIAAGIAETGASVDVHCAVFTPCSFADILAELIGLDLLPFECAALEPTCPWESEFFVLLRKRTDRTAAERAATVPRLDPRRHDALPRPRWPQRLALRLPRRWRRAFR